MKADDVKTDIHLVANFPDWEIIMHFSTEIAILNLPNDTKQFWYLPFNILSRACQNIN